MHFYAPQLLIIWIVWHYSITLRFGLDVIKENLIASSCVIISVVVFVDRYHDSVWWYRQTRSYAVWLVLSFFQLRSHVYFEAQNRLIF